MKKSFTHLQTLLVCGLLGFAGTATAQTGQPHTLKADVSFNNVSLSWKAPASAIELKWHDGNDYNGMDGKQNDPQREVVLYAGAKFTAADLKDYAGQVIDSIDYFEYRDIEDVRVQIYEDGVLKVDQKAPSHAYKKNSWQSVGLSNPYTIPAGKTIIIAAKFTYGYNQNFVAITDRAPQRGKGNIYSYDGKKWYNDGNGDFLITARIRNAATETPTGYNVYDGTTKVNDAALTATTYSLNGVANGQHTYYVEAVYPSGAKKSAGLTVNVKSASSQLSPASTFAGITSELSGMLEWTAPLATGNELTWSNKTVKTGIGGTSTSSPKVWVINEFDANDLIAFPNYKITAIKSYITEKAITGAKVFVMKNGAIDYYEDVADSAVSAIAANSWVTYKLAKPYVMEQGNTYAFGVYYTHTKSAHPVGIDSGTAVDGKGNLFSTSSPRSTDFAKSSPSWKTLASGNIGGNFMLTADVEPVDTATVGASVAGYDLYRNGTQIAKDITASDYSDEVSEPGDYTYRLVTKYNGAKTAPDKQLTLTYTLPESYSAPVITTKEYNDSTKEVKLAWSSSVYKMQKYGTAKYMASFPEDLTMKFGAKFSADEIKPYVGYELREVKFGIGEDVDSFDIQVVDGAGTVLSSVGLKKGDVDPLALYTLTLDKPVTFAANTDYYIVYNAKVPAKNGMMLLDGGPLVDGGAMVNLGGSNWMKLGTIASDFNNYNIVIAGTAYAKSSAAKAKAITLGNDGRIYDNVKTIEVTKEQLDDAISNGYGIESAQPVVAKAERKAPSNPQVASYNVYRNNEIVKNTTEKEYSEILSDYGVYNYYVTAVYSNGWESPASEVVNISNKIAQKTQAPFDLTGTLDNNKTFKLTWKGAAAADELTYAAKNNAGFAFGMTGSSTRESYCAIKFPADTLGNFAGEKITHITFAINDNNLNTAAVFIQKRGSIVYEQSVDVSSLAVGNNIVRLDTPYEIEDDGSDLSIGYHVTYENGIKPLVMDTMPCKRLYSDLISSSASDGYWYSCYSRFGKQFGHNWRISATLAKADATVEVDKAPALAPTTTTYNVYRDGQQIATGVPTTSYDVANAVAGSYTVTAVNNGVESAESNAVVLDIPTGINEVETTGNELKDAPLYNIAGQRVDESYKGVVIQNGKKFIKK